MDIEDELKNAWDEMTKKRSPSIEDRTLGGRPAGGLQEKKEDKKAEEKKEAEKSGEKASEEVEERPGLENEIQFEAGSKISEPERFALRSPVPRQQSIFLPFEEEEEKKEKPYGKKKMYDESPNAQNAMEKKDIKYETIDQMTVAAISPIQMQERTAFEAPKKMAFSVDTGVEEFREKIYGAVERKKLDYDLKEFRKEEETRKYRPVNIEKDIH